jgi:hypothetical protein
MGCEEDGVRKEVEWSSEIMQVITILKMFIKIRIKHNYPPGNEWQVLLACCVKLRKMIIN